MARETLDEKKTEEEEATPVKGEEEEEREKGVEDEEESEDEGTKSAKGSGRKGSSRKPGRDSAEKKEPVTPSSDRPTRERKVVKRYSAPSVARSSSAKPFLIEKGRGTQLKDIPNVAFKLSKRKADDNLQMLHVILFGKKVKPYSLKRNIGQFSGYVWVENEREKQKAKIREKIEKCVKEKLVDFCDLLNIPIAKATVRKEEVSAKLLEFLESPHATTDILLADKEQKGKKRKATPSKSIGYGEALDTSAKKRLRAPQGGEKRKRSSKAEEDEDDDKVESPVSRDDSHEDDADTAPKEENGDEETKSEEEEEPKKSSEKSTSKKTATESPESKSKDKSTSGKKATPAKSGKKSSGSTSKQDVSDGGNSGSKSKGCASKKPKVEKESSKGSSTKDNAAGKKKTNKSSEKVSAKSQGKGKSGKKPKPEPTREETHDVVVNILKKVDFNTATLSDILRQLGTHFGRDLMHRKAEVKDIITEVINNMSDEDEDEEGEESEENADTSGGADKDGDGDD
ncbi:protein DEK-like isoform X3 [Hibiscus syriacus]|uniref:protein DEK-like isoform X3 n=1 Tax=Hibiscus syriacus TaxID=106335 RepID=UPI001921F01F|nr:protein DEK-like isoform X3 [Hibiscus syriacus]